MDYEIRYADSGVAPEDEEPARREWRRDAAALRLEISHEWPPRPVRTGHHGADPYAGYEDYGEYAEYQTR